MAQPQSSPGPGPPSRVDEAEMMLRALVSERRQAGNLRLPPEKELSEQLGIARSTLRAALTRLESDGEIARRRRIGTLITSPRHGWDRGSSLAYPVDVILSLSEYLRAVDVDYAVRAVGIRRTPATTNVATALGLSEGDSIFSASRLYEVTGKPAAFLEHVLPTMLYGHEVHIESLTEGATTFLRDTEQIRLTHTESTITAEAADSGLADDLQIDAGAPVLVMHAKLYAGQPSAVCLGRLVFRPDVLSLTTSASDEETADTARSFGVVPFVKGADAKTNVEEQ